MEQAFIVFFTRQFDQLTVFFEGFFQVTNDKNYLLKIGAFFTKGLGICPQRLQAREQPQLVVDWLRNDRGLIVESLWNGAAQPAQPAYVEPVP